MADLPGQVTSVVPELPASQLGSSASLVAPGASASTCSLRQPSHFKDTRQDTILKSRSSLLAMPDEFAVLSKTSSVLRRRRGGYRTNFSDRELEDLFVLFDPDENGVIGISQVCCMLRTLGMDINEIQAKRVAGGESAPEKWKYNDAVNLVDNIRAQSGVPPMPRRLAATPSFAEQEAEKKFRAVDKLADTVNRTEDDLQPFQTSCKKARTLDHMREVCSRAAKLLSVAAEDCILTQALVESTQVDNRDVLRTIIQAVKQQGQDVVAREHENNKKKQDRIQELKKDIEATRQRIADRKAALQAKEAEERKCVERVQQEADSMRELLKVAEERARGDMTCATDFLATMKQKDDKIEELAQLNQGVQDLLYQYEHSKQRNVVLKDTLVDTLSIFERGIKAKEQALAALAEHESDVKGTIRELLAAYDTFAFGGDVGTNSENAPADS